MKKLILGIVLCALLLAGCELLEPPPVNPFLGTWSYSGDLPDSQVGTITYTFVADMTFSGTYFHFLGDAESGIMQGTYTYTASQLNMTLSDGTTDSVLYVITGNEMTWTWPTSGVSIILTLEGVVG